MALQSEIVQLLSAVGWSARFDSNKRQPSPNAESLRNPAFHRERLACWALVEPPYATRLHRKIVGMIVSLTTPSELVFADTEPGFITYDSN